MLITRPILPSDLDPLLTLASLTGFGLTTLPRDKDLLAERIADSNHAFLRQAPGGGRPRGDTYLFVLEDTSTHRVIGTCGITSKVGGFEPFYAYRLQTTIRQSQMLNVTKEIQTLTLVAEHNGPCEIGSLFLHPDYRHPSSGAAKSAGAGRLLSLSRFLFIAEHPTRFDPTVIAEMRGVIDDQGRSPFWDALGKHFFDIDFPKADYLSMVNKTFIADLMPQHPIYVALLPAEAQAVIGKVHPDTQPALKLLLSQNFRLTDQVDIFEAGPVVQVKRDATSAPSANPRKFSSKKSPRPRWPPPPCTSSTPPNPAPRKPPSNSSPPATPASRKKPPPPSTSRKTPPSATPPPTPPPSPPKPTPTSKSNPFSLTIVQRMIEWSLMRYEIVQLLAFSAKAQRLRLSLDDIREIELAVIENPFAHPVMRGTSGLRKMRFAPAMTGGGKSGGIRVCYFVLDRHERIYLVTLFAKNEKDNLTRTECNTIAAWITAIRKQETRS